MEDLLKVFSVIYRLTIDYHIECRYIIENKNSLQMVNRHVSMAEIRQAFFASIFAIIMETKEDQLILGDNVILADDVEQTSQACFNDLLPEIKQYLKEKGVEIRD